MTLRVLVTGASGFVGRNILSNLAEVEVHAVSRHPQEGGGRWHVADLLDPEACRAMIDRVRPDVLVHVAWETEHGVFWEAESNLQWLEGGKVLFSAMRSIPGARIVGVGTCAEYPALDHAAEETEVTGTPATLYGRAKRELLEHLQGLGMPYAWARVFHAFGPDENPHRFVPQVARALIAGEPANCSSGVQIRDFMDVRDLGRAIAELALSRLTGPINLGSGDPRPLRDIARMMGDILARPDLVRLGALPDRPGEPPILVPNLRRQFDELGFHPRVPLRDGLAESCRYWAGDQTTYDVSTC